MFAERASGAEVNADLAAVFFPGFSPASDPWLTLVSTLSIIVTIIQLKPG